MAGPNWKLEEDLKHVSVTFPTDPPVRIQLDVAAVDDILKNLGAFRAAMQPEVPKSITLGQKVEAIPDPIWMCEPDLMHGHSLIHLRDPRFGWLHYLLPPHEAKKLGQLLQTQAENPPTLPSSKKSN